MTDWSPVRTYIHEAEGYARTKVEEGPGSVAESDQAVSGSLAGLRDLYGVDVTDEAVAYALIVGFAVAYRYGCRAVMQDRENPRLAAYLSVHGPLSGNIGLVAAQIVRNLGLSLPSPGAAE